MYFIKANIRDIFHKKQPLYKYKLDISKFTEYDCKF